MADYVVTLIRIEGPPAALHDAAARYFTKGSFDLNDVVRMPLELDVPINSASETGHAALYGDWRSVSQYWMFKEYASKLGFPFPLESREQVIVCLRNFDNPDMYLRDGAALQRNLETHGHLDARSWMSANWGSDRNVDEVRVDRSPDCISVRFVTPWRFPRKAIETIGARHPDLRFVVYTSDEYGRNAKAYAIVRGRLKLDRSTPPDAIRTALSIRPSQERN